MNQTNLRIPPAEVNRELAKRISEGKKILDTNYIDMDEARLEEMRDRRDIWDDFNAQYLKTIFTDNSIADEYTRFAGGVVTAGATLERRRSCTDKTIREKLKRLESVRSRLTLMPQKQASIIRGMRSFPKHQTKGYIKTGEKLHQKYWWLVVIPILVYLAQQWISKSLGLSN